MLQITYQKPKLLTFQYYMPKDKWDNLAGWFRKELETKGVWMHNIVETNEKL